LSDQDREGPLRAVHGTTQASDRYFPPSMCHTRLPLLVPCGSLAKSARLVPYLRPSALTILIITRSSISILLSSVSGCKGERVAGSASCGASVRDLTLASLLTFFLDVLIRSSVYSPFSFPLLQYLLPNNTIDTLYRIIVIITLFEPSDLVRAPTQSRQSPGGL
jgi:hypothetical protein